jgi:cytochrome c biogenesis protein CcdA
VIAAPVGVVKNFLHPETAPLWFFAFGALLSSILLGASLGLVGLMLPRGSSALQLSLAGIVIGLSGVGLVREHRNGGGYLPTRCWQVPREWNAFGVDVHGFLFGFCLGLGFVTFVTFIGYYLALVLAAMQGSVLRSIGVFGAYGIGRAFPLFLYSWLNARGKERLVEVLFAPVSPSRHGDKEWLAGVRAASLVSAAAAAALIAGVT